MKEYKVKTVHVKFTSWSASKNLAKAEEEMEKVLNKYAQEGWRLVSTNANSNQGIAALFYLFLERDIRSSI